jgi:hypothetical protein
MSKRLKQGATIEAHDKLSGKTIKGTIKTYDEKSGVMEVLTPSGQTKTIDILNFIVVVLPLLDQIIDWIISKFKKK